MKAHFSKALSHFDDFTIWLKEAHLYLQDWHSFLVSSERYRRTFWFGNCSRSCLAWGEAALDSQRLSGFSHHSTCCFATNLTNLRWNDAGLMISAFRSPMARSGSLCRRRNWVRRRRSVALIWTRSPRHPCGRTAFHPFFLLDIFAENPWGWNIIQSQ